MLNVIESEESVHHAEVSDTTITVFKGEDSFFKPVERWSTMHGDQLDEVTDALVKRDVKFTFTGTTFIEKVLNSVLHIFFVLLAIAIIIVIVAKMTGADVKIGDQKLIEGKKRYAENVKETFADVGGHEGPKEEVSELVAFLKNPKKFEQIGAQVPKGILFHGPPGTGKTLLARAVAGEAGVPFLYMNGSKFAGTYVAQGVNRVEDLFAEARKHGQAIIFIDEIDGVGATRTSGRSGAARDDNRTLNSLLTEMDGFEQNEGTIVIAATNLIENLDPALLRPGRFDRHIYLGPPNEKVREDILGLHARDYRMAGDVDLNLIARLTPGMVGADLRNLINEGAIRATREDRTEVITNDLREAIERLVVGHKERGHRLSEQDRKTVAVHEAGHAIAMACEFEANRVGSVSIIATSQGALGYNLTLPEDEADASLHTHDEQLAMICHLLGGRAAEEIVIGQVSTGASDDLRRATQIARRMVEVYGMSEGLLNVVFYPKDGRWSEETARDVDEEIRKIIAAAYERAKKIMTKNKDVIIKISDHLLENEELKGAVLQEHLATVIQRMSSERKTAAL